jgi:hypothetical protein
MPTLRVASTAGESGPADNLLMQLLRSNRYVLVNAATVYLLSKFTEEEVKQKMRADGWVVAQSAGAAS